jgi:hypothetical protein
MSKDQSAPTSLPSSDQTGPEAVAQDTGATKEQVAQLARVAEDNIELEDASAAAARWS